MKQIKTDECAKMIRAALKQGFPLTKFSVRASRGNIDVRWTDGPVLAQIKPILDRFVSSGFDGMTDCGYYCGKRTLLGVEVDVNGGYVTGQREVSPQLRMLVAKKLIQESGADVTPTLSEYGKRIQGCEVAVPYAWYGHYLDKPYLTVEEFASRPYILAHDAHSTEYLSHLISRVESYISLEEQKPIAPELLPDYIDITAKASTGRTPEEDKRPMFAGHSAFTEAQEQADAAAIASFDETVVLPVIEFNCRVGRSYPKPTAAIHLISNRVQ